MRSINCAWITVILVASNWNGVDTLANRIGSDHGSISVREMTSQVLTLDQLDSLIENTGPRQVRYQETHVSRLLTKPLVSSGILKFSPPDQLEKHVLIPQEERYRIVGNTIFWEKPAQTSSRVISLEAYPSLHSFTKAFLAVLGGNVESLNKLFAVNLEGTRTLWRLVLTPSEEEVREFVVKIEFTGRVDVITEIRIDDTSGDYSIMKLIADEK